MEQEMYIKVFLSEVRELEEKDGFWDNAYPYYQDDGELDFFFVAKSWYDRTNYNDYLNSFNN